MRYALYFLAYGVAGISYILAAHEDALGAGREMPKHLAIHFLLWPMWFLVDIFRAVIALGCINEKG